MNPALGFLCCHKPLGMTSRDLVNIVHGRVRAELRQANQARDVKVGHCGTLDPLAEGVMVIGVGSASRLTPYVQEQPKRYRTTMRLGASSPSGDLEETVVEHPELPLPTIEQLRQAALQFVGETEQRPPAHSAVWVDGKRAYDRARRGEIVNMPSRVVRIHELQVLSLAGRDVELECLCGSGTYIRSLVMDLAIAVDSRAVMTKLVRTAIGEFQLCDALSIEQIRPGPLAKHLRPLLAGVTHLPRLQVDDHDVDRLRNGLFVAASVPAWNSDGTVSDADEAMLIDGVGLLRGILRRESGYWKPYRIFHEP